MLDLKGKILDFVMLVLKKYIIVLIQNWLVGK